MNIKYFRVSGVFMVLLILIGAMSAFILALITEHTLERAGQVKHSRPTITYRYVVECDPGDYLYDANGKIIGTPHCCSRKTEPNHADTK